ncbi:isopentenyl-diphosphate delta-isomerase [Thiohalorhabdus denitrificans]|uniref:Predicted ATPase of the ABC class n=1 Tax=Thiohalorhabdus denitrificans TaxID=381306 RepID=A0A0P9EDY1_9GAMM|nr:ABC-ATPase domain-containing protein [Thiohalorhabdus denitrificans]KPV40562.1 isopentenyl-diphosphate delta-isomerase [Thiohalorhabdus denitrificans]SCY51295.1 Predicted ATPase of the ABC class [Thiohalorhabdus denitrificans]
MADAKQLEQTLERIDGRGYKAYKDIAGRYDFERFTLLIDHVQADPFAAPSRLRAVVPWAVADLPEAVHASPSRARAARDFLARAFRRAAREEQDVGIDAGRQTVLERTACLFTEAGVELRFTASLPAAGRKILGRKARELLCDRLPRIVRDAAEAARLDTGALLRHCAAVEDQVALREALAERDLVAFVGDGAVLPRRSGVDDRPLADAIPWQSPESLRVTLPTPNAGEVTGMGVPRGITLIVGGGFHGKSTLLNALETGVYDHVPGDGREQIVADPTAVKVRAEDGRAVSGVDLSPFINHLPYGKSTSAFSTDLASGSTSQAAALQEALEAGCRSLLVDEDTSATNFMIRDERMQALVAKESEPITPFVDRIRQLRDRLGISTILVMGGSGDYFDCADTVVQMQEYVPLDVTDKAREIAATHVTGRREEHETDLEAPRVRALDTRSVDPTVKQGKRKVQGKGRDHLVFGREDVDLRAVEQVADTSQVRAVGQLLAKLSDEGGTVADPPAWLRERLEGAEWHRLFDKPDGDLARPRVFEAMAALNRLRGARLE